MGLLDFDLPGGRELVSKGFDLGRQFLGQKGQIDVTIRTERDAEWIKQMFGPIAVELGRTLKIHYSLHDQVMSLTFDPPYPVGNFKGLARVPVPAIMINTKNIQIELEGLYPDINLRLVESASRRDADAIMAATQMRVVKAEVVSFVSREYGKPLTRDKQKVVELVTDASIGWWPSDVSYVVGNAKRAQRRCREQVKDIVKPQVRGMGLGFLFMTFIFPTLLKMAIEALFNWAISRGAEGHAQIRLMQGHLPPAPPPDFTEIT